MDYSLMRRLNEDETRFLGYLRSRGGIAYLYEVRRALGIPSSSTWRMARRLNEWGFISLEKIKIGKRILLKVLLRK